MSKENQRETAEFKESAEPLDIAGTPNTEPIQESAAASTAEPIPKPKLGAKAIKDIALYGFLRVLLFLVLTFVIHLIVILLGMGSFFPLLISAMLALIIAFPLSMFLFKKLRIRTTEQLAEWDAGRRAHKMQMRRQLEDRLG